MNRRKKSIQIVKSRIKKAKAKLSTNKKPKYISKAERARLEKESESKAIDSADNVDNADS